MNKLLFLSVLWLLAFQQSNAFAGREGNGGDMCEDRFQIIRDDIRLWVEKGGAQGLQLPASITWQLYNQKILNAISTATISCTDDVLQINGEEKTCENWMDDKGLKIQCNRKRFMETTDDNQYTLVHHEYAGLAGFETNDGAISIYPISNQITGFLETRYMKSLVVKPAGGLPEFACASRYIVKKKGWNTERHSALGPSIQVQPSTIGLPWFVSDVSHPDYSYDAKMNPDGRVDIVVNLGLGGTQKPFYQASSSAFVSGTYVAEAMVGTMHTWYPVTDECKIHYFDVVCAADQKTAEAALDAQWGAADFTALPGHCDL